MESQQPRQPGEYTAGRIVSIQNDKDGKSKWLLFGAWNGAKINIEKEESQVNTHTSTSINVNSNTLPIAVFEANFDKVMLNGASLHEHKIYIYILSHISMTKEKHYTFNGTATITMKDGAVNDVPMSITTLNNNLISIWTDQVKINDHFGKTPRYGEIIQDIVIKK